MLGPTRGHATDDKKGHRRVLEDSVETCCQVEVASFSHSRISGADSTLLTGQTTFGHARLSRKDKLSDFFDSSAKKSPTKDSEKRVKTLSSICK